MPRSAPIEGMPAHIDERLRHILKQSYQNNRSNHVYLSLLP